MPNLPSRRRAAVAALGGFALAAALAPAADASRADDPLPERFVGLWGLDCSQPLVELTRSGWRIPGLDRERAPILSVTMTADRLTIVTTLGPLHYRVLAGDRIQGLSPRADGGQNPPMHRCGGPGRTVSARL